jgi:hypothetical protein
MKELGDKVFHGPFDFAKRSRVNIDYLPQCAIFDVFQASAQEDDSVVSCLLKRIVTGDSRDNQDELEMAAKRATSVMYAAGSDTVSLYPSMLTRIPRMADRS